MMNKPLDRRRRHLLRIALGSALVAPAVRATAGASPPSSHLPFGPVLPIRAIPAWPVTTQRSLATDLASLLRGKVSAVQLMFTGCSATCPIQGALFAQAQRSLQGRPSTAQFVSISIDPLSDSPAALDAWLRKFTAAPGWLAVAPRIDDVDRIFEVLGEGGENRPKGSTDPHTGQVYIVNRRGELVFRTPSQPPSEQIVAILRQVDGMA